MDVVMIKITTIFTKKKNQEKEYLLSAHLIYIIYKGFSRGKKMQLDITGILRDWEYDPDNYIRVITLKDGREVLQVRQPLGIEQYELSGRPDGKRPFDRESVLDEFLYRIDYHTNMFSSEENFRLSYDDFIMLQDEGMLYYARYLRLYQIGDFEKTVDDTAHNLRICELLDKYFYDDEVKNELLQYRPYIMKVNAISRAMVEVQNKFLRNARQILKSAITFILNLKEIDTPTFKLEKKRSLDALHETLLEISDTHSTEIDNLEFELAQAVEKEDYEHAAEIRDQISKLKRERTKEQG
jgi:hypothetical protein